MPINYHSIDVLADVLSNIFGTEMIPEDVPHAPYAKRFRCPQGQLVNFFSTTGSVTVQGRGDIAGLESQLELNQYRMDFMEPYRPPICPVFQPAKTANEVIVLYGDDKTRAKYVIDELSELGLAPVLWDIKSDPDLLKRSTEIYRMRPSLTFVIAVTSAKEWSRVKTRSALGLAANNVGPQQTVVLYDSPHSPKPALPENIRCFRFNSKAQPNFEDAFQDAITYLSTRAETRLNRIIYQASRRRYKILPRSVEDESGLEVWEKHHEGRRRSHKVSGKSTDQSGSTKSKGKGRSAPNTLP